MHGPSHGVGSLCFYWWPRTTLPHSLYSHTHTHTDTTPLSDTVRRKERGDFRDTRIFPILVDVTCLSPFLPVSTGRAYLTTVHVRLLVQNLIVSNAPQSIVSVSRDQEFYQDLVFYKWAWGSGDQKRQSSGFIYSDSTKITLQDNRTTTRSQWPPVSPFVLFLSLSERFNILRYGQTRYYRPRHAKDQSHLEVQNESKKDGKPMV